jgi:hypothetical protein
MRRRFLTKILAKLGGIPVGWLAATAYLFTYYADPG